MFRTPWLLVVGLIILLSGGLLLAAPDNEVVAQYKTVLEVNPMPFNSADLAIRLGYGQSAKITVVFDENSSSYQREVWPVISYSFPTKTVSETPVRFVNESVVCFELGWKNTSYMDIFVTGFSIRVFYFGNNPTSVNVTVTKTGNPLTEAGIGMLVTSAIPFWAILAVSRQTALPKNPPERLALAE